MDADVLKTLKEQMALFEKQTPSSPDWYRVIDAVVGTLLALEIQRREKRRLAHPQGGDRE